MNLDDRFCDRCEDRLVLHLRLRVPAVQFRPVEIAFFPMLRGKLNLLGECV